MNTTLTLVIIATVALALGIRDGVGRFAPRVAIYIVGFALSLTLAIEMVTHHRPFADAVFVAAAFPLAIDDWLSASVATRSLVFAIIVSVFALALPPFNVTAPFNLMAGVALFIAMRVAERYGQRLPIADSLTVCLTLAVLGIPGSLTVFAVALVLVALGLLDRRRPFMERMVRPVLIPIAGLVVAVAFTILALPLPWSLQ